MTTEQNVLDDLIQAIDDTNRSNDDFLKVLKEGRDQDVALRDGTVVPSLTKRVVNAFSNSDYLMKADNLASVVDKQVARNNLNVPTKEEVAQATETIKGTAKIATTAIAQAGSNDTDIITPLKLRSALNASGNAPISACRAWVTWEFLSNVITIKSSFNVLSIVRVSQGLYDISFTTPMPHNHYCCFGMGSSDAGGSDPSNYTVKFPKGHVQTVNTVRVSTSFSSGGYSGVVDPEKCCIGVFC